ncbi:hypothetical protein UPYG_G00096480 [Umbra pygmaea]|uniref:Membrane-spanning 4-domains subfamily A member 4A-like n=1 Tax=Umbra pygmaea TaxID=75934 RepID=A0ABD0XPS3_UMBPY
MIGVIMLLFGIAMAAGSFPGEVGVYSGIFVWGAIIYIIAGSLTVAADNQLSVCLVKGSMGMNVVATIISLTGIILYIVDAAGISYCNYSSNPFTQYNTYNPFTNPSPSPDAQIILSKCQKYWMRSQGISGVLVIFSLLEFIVSICASSFACKAVCQCCCCHKPEQVIIQVPYDNQLTPGGAPLPPSYETVENAVFQEYDQTPKYPAVTIHSDLM